MATSLFPPQGITLHKRSSSLEIVWKNGVSSVIAGKELRRFCACSGCRARKIVGMLLINESTTIDTINLMGATGLQIIFEDGHDRGIYPWDYLHAIAQGDANTFFEESSHQDLRLQASNE